MLHICLHPVEDDLTISCGEDGSVKIWLLATRQGAQGRARDGRASSADTSVLGAPRSRVTFAERLARGLDACASLVQGVLRRLPALKMWKISRLKPIIESKLEQTEGKVWQDVLPVLEGLTLRDIEACLESGDLEFVFQLLSGAAGGHDTPRFPAGGQAQEDETLDRQDCGIEGRAEADSA